MEGAGCRLSSDRRDACIMGLARAPTRVYIETDTSTAKKPRKTNVLQHDRKNNNSIQVPMKETSGTIFYSTHHLKHLGYLYFFPLAALFLGARVLGAVTSFSGSLSAFGAAAVVVPLRAPRPPLAATAPDGNGTFSGSSSLTCIRSGVFSFSPTVRAALFPYDAPTPTRATTRPLPAVVAVTVVARFEAAPAAVPVVVPTLAVGVRLPLGATRSVPVTASVPVLSSSISAAATLVFPRRPRTAPVLAVDLDLAPAGGTFGCSARDRSGPSSAGVSSVTSAAFLDFARTRRLVVVGAGAGACTSTD